VNFKKSKGNYFTDIDGNVVLDLHCNYSHNPLGYNHDALINVIYSSNVVYEYIVKSRRSIRQVPKSHY
jgi:4-aminobutyrate aminotransferase-like enzyme